MTWGVGGRRGSDPTLLWLWRRPAATAPIRSPSLGTSICRGSGPRNSNNNNKKKKRQTDKKNKTKHRHEGACAIDTILEHESLSMKVKPVYLSMPKMNGKHLGPGYFQASPRLPNMRRSVCEIRKSTISLNLCHLF